MQSHDPMHWQLTLVRERRDAETSEIKIVVVKDTYQNRNQGRFAKMAKPKDERFMSRGAGVVHTPPKWSRATLDALRVDGCVRSFAQAGDEARIVDPTVFSRRMRRAMR